MKKFIVTIILALVASLAFTAFAQVEYQKPTPKKFELLVVESVPNLVLMHYLANDSYTIGIGAEKPSIDSTISIKLGEGKDTAIASLKAIRQMLVDAEHGGFVTISGKAWSARKRNGKAVLAYKQDRNLTYNLIDLVELDHIIKALSTNTLKVAY